MALTPDLIVAAMSQNKIGNVSSDDANLAIANAIVETIKLLQIEYESGLIGVSPGSPIAPATLVATII